MFICIYGLKLRHVIFDLRQLTKGKNNFVRETPNVINENVTGMKIQNVSIKTDYSNSQNWDSPMNRCAVKRKTAFGLLMGIVLTAASPIDAGATDTVVKNPVKIYSYDSHFWGDMPFAQITNDKKYLIYITNAQLYVKDLVTGNIDNITEQLGYETSGGFSLRNSDKCIYILNSRKGDVFENVSYSLIEKKIVTDSFTHPQKESSCIWSADGKTVYYSTWDNVLWMKTEGSDAVKLLSNINYGALAMALSPDEKHLAFLAQYNSVPILREIRLDNPSVYTVNKMIDGKLEPQFISYSSDGRKIYVSLATQSLPSNDLRKVPYAKRNMKVFSVDRASSMIKLEVQLAHDNLFIGRASDKLVWINSNNMYRTVVYNIEGTQRISATDSSVLFSAWNSDASALTMTYGNWRNAEIFLNFDLGLNSVDANGNISKTISPIVQQNGVDMGMICSPDGEWYAYQSNTQMYAQPHFDWGDKPKIYAKPVSGGSAVALTNTNTEINEGVGLNNPIWSPDSKKILYSGVLEMYSLSEKERPYIVYFDPVKGIADSVRPFDVDVEGHLSGYDWSPTRKEIVFEQRDTVDILLHSLWLVDESGDVIAKLVTFKACLNFPILDFTSNGDTIYYSALSENGYHQIYKISREGGTPVKVTANDTVHLCAPQISPDGKLLACTEYNNYYEIWMGDETLDPLSYKQLRASDLDITILPTVVDKTLKIHCAEVPNGSIRIEVYSNVGVKCMQESFSMTKAMSDFELSVDKLGSGAYYIKFETESASVVREFIKK